MKTLIGANIRSARTEAGLTQRQLAAQVNDMDSIAVSRWECGRVMPSASSMVALAQVLERDVAWFYTDHDPQESAA